MSWKISRIEVSNFKAFKFINLDLGASSLLTLDGPNGYGKTSIFDAIELLLTGKIKRVQNLFSTLMTAHKKNYDDNLLWNTRSGKQDLSIKIEFISGNRKLILARYATVKTLETRANNRADKFHHFSLYELPDFESDGYIASNRRDDDFLDKTFGKNFRENFSFLNYLEQGQNKLLHTRVDERKDALGSLFNIGDVTAEIESCRLLEARLSKYIRDESRKATEDTLVVECAALREMVQADTSSVEYKKITNIEDVPSWDKENPFPTYDAGLNNQYLESIRKLMELLSLKAVVRTRAENEAIEADINIHAESIISLARLGTDLSRLDALDQAKNDIDQLCTSLSILKKGALSITIEQLHSIPGLAPDQLKWFEDQITARNKLQTLNSANETAAAELTRLKQQLLEQHSRLNPNDELCPLCGNDWKTHSLLLEAVEIRARKIEEALSKHGRELVTLISSMTSELSSVELYIQEREAMGRSGYSDALHKALLAVKNRIYIIQQLSDRLKTQGIQIDFTFSDDETVVAARIGFLRSSMQSRKMSEIVELPDDWRQIIGVAFKDLESFYICDPQDLTNKEMYINIKANEARSSRLQKCLNDLQRIRRENEAAKIAKDKVGKLRTTLEKAEQKYADQTISEIELIFHIYSGRLIQNYQRGLGLFIESRVGKELRFLTAEKSDHDAVMSMSSGQVSALSLAFFLSLNKVYADVPLILIDDPSQSLDDVNIASLTDLLRCELKHCQLIVSSHEEDISAYMRYRFDRAGLATNSLNMQRLAKQGA